MQESCSSAVHHLTNLTVGIFDACPRGEDPFSEALSKTSPLLYGLFGDDLGEPAGLCTEGEMHSSLLENYFFSTRHQQKEQDDNEKGSSIGSFLPVPPPVS